MVEREALLGQAVDETGLGANTILDATNPFADVEWGPAAADTRHRISASAIAPIGWGVQVAPIVYFRSALPVATVENIDRNGDFSNNELPDRAYAFNGVGKPAKDTGACETLNCGRGARFTQVNVRVSKTFGLSSAVRLDLIGELFNAFDAANPTAFNPRRMTNASTAIGAFMQPASFAGDFQQGEQRVGQIGIRVRFGK